MTTDQHTNARKVSRWYPTSVRLGLGGGGQRALRLILDNGAAEHVVAVAKREAGLVSAWLIEGPDVYFDTERETLEFFGRQLTVRARRCSTLEPKGMTHGQSD